MDTVTADADRVGAASSRLGADTAASNHPDAAANQSIAPARPPGEAPAAAEVRSARAAPGGVAALEDAIAAVAARQHGLITRAQLFSIGLGSDAVDGRVKTKRLRPVHRGVYRVGPLAPPKAKVMAAVLACGPGAIISNASAGVLWRLLAPRDDRAPVELTVAGRDRRRRPGMRVHRSVRLPPDEVSAVAGIPATSPGRTLLDLAGVLGARELEQALARAERQRLTDRGELLALAGRYPNHRGARRLRALLEQRGTPALTRSEAEERFLALIRKAQLPAPEVNARVGGYEVDFLWRAERLVVEVDGFAFHSTPASFERDRQRDMRLAAAGLQVLRVTWRQVAREPEATAVRVGQTLARCVVPSGGRIST